MAIAAQGSFGSVRPAARPYGNAHEYGGKTLGRAVEGAVEFKTALGLPSYDDLFKQFGGPGTQEWGNAGAAGEGARWTRENAMQSRADLQAQQANIRAAREGARNPTGTEGFQSVMRLAGDRTAAAAQEADRGAAAAAQRRGYAGGYNPAATERARLGALADAGGEAALAERKFQTDLLGQENEWFGTQADIYGNDLSAYTDLTKSYAELPTKYLSAYSDLLSGLGGYGDLFGTALKGAMFEEEPDRWALQEAADARGDARKFGYGERAADSAASRSETAAQSDFERQQAAEREQLAARYRASGRDPSGRPYGSANPTGTRY
jgi:hypothetical protein